MKKGAYILYLQCQAVAILTWIFVTGKMKARSMTSTGHEEREKRPVARQVHGKTEEEKVHEPGVLWENGEEA